MPQRHKKTDFAIVPTAVTTPEEFRITTQLAKAIGPDLMGAARQKREHVLKTSMLACAEDLLRQIEVIEQRTVENNKRIAQLNERIKDVEEGRFTVNRDGQVIFPHLPPPHLP